MAACVMVSGLYAPLTACQVSGQPTRRRCAANSRLAGTLKPVFTSAAVNSVNSSVRPHVYAEPMNQCDWSVSVCMSLSNGVWYGFVQTVCAAAAGLRSDISYCWCSFSLKGRFTKISKKKFPTHLLWYLSTQTVLDTCLWDFCLHPNKMEVNGISFVALTALKKMMFKKSQLTQCSHYSQ